MQEIQEIWEDLLDAQMRYQTTNKPCAHCPYENPEKDKVAEK